MKLYLWTAGWGWWLVGIGYKTKWFFGLSIAQDKSDVVAPPSPSDVPVIAERMGWRNTTTDQFYIRENGEWKEVVYKQSERIES